MYQIRYSYIHPYCYICTMLSIYHKYGTNENCTCSTLVVLLEAHLPHFLVIWVLKDPDDACPRCGQSGLQRQHDDLSRACGSRNPTSPPPCPCGPLACCLPPSLCPSSNENQRTTAEQARLQPHVTAAAPLVPPGSWPCPLPPPPA